MTTTRAATPTSAPLPPALRAALAVPGVVGPLAVTVVVLAPAYPADAGYLEIAAAIAANRGAVLGHLWLGLLFALSLPVAVLVSGSVARRGAPALGTVGLVIGFLGALGLLGIGPGLDAIGIGAARAGIGPVTTAHLLTEVEAITPVAVVGCGWLVAAFGVLVLGIALWVGRTVPMWAAAALSVSFPSIVVGHLAGLGPVAGAAGWVLLAVGFGTVGVVYARHES